MHVTEALEERLHGSCRCRVRDVACTCGCVVGYHVILPCRSKPQGTAVRREKEASLAICRFCCPGVVHPPDASSEVLSRLVSCRQHLLIGARLTSRNLQSNSLAQALFTSYALNLLGGAAWTASGVYVHLFEPLPQEPTIAWQIFLNMGATTPFLFPLVVRDAFYRDSMSSSAARLQDVSAAICALLYALLVWGSFDLAAGRKLPPIAVSPWHTIDGRSYAGAAFGVKFDLLSSMPSARSDSEFVLSGLFMASNALSAMLLLNVCYNRVKARVL
ncbi:unnamed protein product [Symbiodinium natans]|uniref:Uncharacterized protein n=1 Tax=Symbiodinium natans TaxID=878477 RepID=A0A812U5R8_9DINO|nr:unnamed protein product [Symbiodinium natans]